MTKYQRCPIKIECKAVGLHVKDNKGERVGHICPLLFLIDKYIVTVMRQAKEKEKGGASLIA